jgi:hypothetical protein
LSSLIVTQADDCQVLALSRTYTRS